MKNSESSERAKARWKLLFRTIKGSKDSDEDYDLHSTRSFTGFNLFDVKQIEEYNHDGCLWFWYRLKKFEECAPVKVRHLQDTTRTADLIGFDNTGNICVWPAEEVLTYYCLKNKNIFKDKSVCELGCGMTGLAGLQIAGNSECSRVLLTDGNDKAVENLRSIIEENTFGETEVACDVLRWGEELEQLKYSHGMFDTIICADCLFFVGVQKKLLHTIKELMQKEGLCIIFAPKRSGTFDKFVDLAEQMFLVNIEERYDDHIWHLHEVSGVNKLYSPDLHYPVMITLSHR